MCGAIISTEHPEGAAIERGSCSELHILYILCFTLDKVAKLFLFVFVI